MLLLLFLLFVLAPLLSLTLLANRSMTKKSLKRTEARRLDRIRAHIAAAVVIQRAWRRCLRVRQQQQQRLSAMRTQRALLAAEQPHKHAGKENAVGSNTAAAVASSPSHPPAHARARTAAAGGRAVTYRTTGTPRQRRAGDTATGADKASGQRAAARTRRSGTHSSAARRRPQQQQQQQQQRLPHHHTTAAAIDDRAQRWKEMEVAALTIQLAWRRYRCRHSDGTAQTPRAATR